MPIVLFGSILEQYPRVGLASIVLAIVLGAWIAIDISNEKQVSDAKFNTYMATCIERHTEPQCFAYWRWDRADLAK